MAASNYAALDAAIIEAVRGGADSFGAVQDSPITRALAEDQPGKRVDFRVLDRRLQALKRLGKLKFDRPARHMSKCWMVIE